MRILVACEESGTVRDAFRAKGHEAFSCDLLPDRNSSPYHKQQDVLQLLDDSWDMIIAHPPCTYLTTTGARWLYDSRFPNRFKQREDAVEFTKMFWDAAPLVCIENPVGYLSTAWKKPSQIIQPWEYGHDASKKTCLWLNGLPKLIPTEIVEVTYVTTSTGRRFSKWYWDTSKKKGVDRQRERSKTFDGIAKAMAEQWG